LRRVPARWQGKAAVLAALAATTGIIALRWAPTRVDGAADAVAQVAPIFPHGDGRGSFGCDAVAPPVFLSEDEARQVITEELKAAGLDAKADAQTLADVPIPVTSLFGETKETKPGALVLDAVDTTKHVAVEFVSQADYVAWAGKEAMMSSVERYNALAAAQLLRDGLAAKAPAGAYGVVYDPMVGPAEVRQYVEAQKRTYEWKTYEADG
jgi:hypothetical protein